MGETSYGRSFGAPGSGTSGAGSLGRVESFSTIEAGALTNIQNRGEYVRLRVSESVTVSAITIHVLTQSGNIELAVFANNGLEGTLARPAARKATTGAIAMPAAGAAAVAIDVTIDDGDWLYLGSAAASGAARWATCAPGLTSAIYDGLCGYKDTDYPSSSTAPALSSGSSRPPLVASN